MMSDTDVVSSWCGLCFLPKLIRTMTMIILSRKSFIFNLATSAKYIFAQLCLLKNSSPQQSVRVEVKIRLDLWYEKTYSEIFFVELQRAIL